MTTCLRRSRVDHGDATGQQSTQLLEQAVSDSICPGRLGGCSWPPCLSGDGPGGPPWRQACSSSRPAALSGGVCIPADCPRTAAIPERDTGRKAPLDPKDGISVIAMSMAKALWGGRRARRSDYIFYIQLLPYGQVMSAPNLRSVNDSILYRTVTFDLHIEELLILSASRCLEKEAAFPHLPPAPWEAINLLLTQTNMQSQFPSSDSKMQTLP